MRKINKKIIPALLIGGILSSQFAFTAHNAYASTLTPSTEVYNQQVINTQFTLEEEKQVEELAAQLQFLNEEALIEQDGNRTFDFEKVKNKLGSDYANNLENDITMVGELAFNKVKDPFSRHKRSAWTDCMVDAIKDHFGVSAVTAALEGGLWAYLQKKAYKEAAKLLVKFAVGSNAVGLAGTLVYYGGKCTYQHG